MTVDSIKWFSPTDLATRGPHPIPSWITDPDVRDSIRDGLIDIPDELLRRPS
ncbi:hypothetical protein [Streptomyces sp. NPDC059538]|uniref:hypothetical protein n=1 Tax=Streptomyces sp. NPDC059538 TaxID=3346860 RepID=UPI0036C02823